MRCLVLHTLAVALAVGQSFNKPHDNQTLIVMVAPSFYDETYREDFVDLINFQLDFAKTIHSECTRERLCETRTATSLGF